MPRQRITKELLLRRAEHNDGQLSTLREITLHQFDIEKIELLDVYCRNLRILFLQNNQITIIENLHKLKDLQYLNLALNNITLIQNLDKCESLSKLDLTVNFIDDIFCIESLIPCENLRELYLTGNPVTSKPGYREFTICTLPQLNILDGTPITQSERIRARQTYLDIKATVKNIPVHTPYIPNCNELDKIESSVTEENLSTELNHVPSEHTPMNRMTAARYLARIRANNDPQQRYQREREQRKSQSQHLKHKNRVTKDGRILQCNEPQVLYEFHDHSKDYGIIILQVKISKLIDTSLLDVNLYHDYIDITIQGKRLILCTPELIDPNRYNIIRSQTTGTLMIYMTHINISSTISIDELIEKWNTYERDIKLRNNKVSSSLKQQHLLSSTESIQRQLDQLQYNSESINDDDNDDDNDVPPLV